MLLPVWHPEWVSMNVNVFSESYVSNPCEERYQWSAHALTFTTSFPPWRCLSATAPRQPIYPLFFQRDHSSQADTYESSCTPIIYLKAMSTVLQNNLCELLCNTNTFWTQFQQLWLNHERAGSSIIILECKHYRNENNMLNIRNVNLPPLLPTVSECLISKRGLTCLCCDTDVTHKASVNPTCAPASTWCRAAVTAGCVSHPSTHRVQKYNKERGKPLNMMKCKAVSERVSSWEREHSFAKNL